MPRRPTSAPRPLLPVDHQVNGKTVTRRLSETEAELYEEWIANDRRLRQLIQQMRQLAAKAAQLKLKQATSP